MSALEFKAAATPATAARAAIAVVTNTTSRRNRGRMNQVRAALTALPGSRHFETVTVADLDAVVERILHDEFSLLVINGGDGTVQHLLSRLAVFGDLATLPPLAVLPGGTTNMTAHDLNGGRLTFRRAFAQLQRWQSRPSAASVGNRHVLAVRAGQGSPLHGLFFGMGAVLKGIEYTQQHIYRSGVGGEEASGLALVRTVWGLMRGDGGFSEPTPMRLSVAGHNRDVAACLLLASTLERLFLGIRPWWGGHDGPVRATLVEDPPQRLLRNLPALLRGRPGERMNAATGYHSWSSMQLDIASTGRFTIDGEIYAHAGDRIQVGTAGPLRVLALARVGHTSREPRS